ncbi:MAG TPA: hypothetical protein VGK25_14245 [Ignavibacteria bacterium]|jgi:hypothetical protein
MSLYLLLLFTFCGEATHNYTPSQIYNDTLSNYKWAQVLPFGNGSFAEDWKPGTFPLGIMPIIAYNGNLWMIGLVFT